MDGVAKAGLAGARQDGRTRWCGIAALVLAATFWSAPAGAQGLLDFLFGSPQQRSAPPPPAQLPPPTMRSPSGDISLPSGQINPNQQILSSGSSRVAAYCVRLCDGRYFPLERHAAANPVQLCSSFCPASPTKVFNGGEITSAVASDGTRYAALKNAYLYRKQLITDCTCNGKDVFGLAPIDVKSDPTLRPGDTVATADGVMTVDRRDTAP